ncbi:TIGR00156 family protein [Spirochaetia bacterium]|nr:TIGR00156 family protein [Spirochaetia bacterium]
MKKSTFWVICFLLIVLSASSVYGQGFTGPGAGTANGQVQTVTVIQARGLPDHSLVILTGTIVQSLGREKYTFRDSTGDITIDIDRDLWTLLGISVGTNDRIEIGGKIDVEKRVVEIDVKYIKKL